MASLLLETAVIGRMAGLDAPDLETVLEAAPGRCCVAIRPGRRIREHVIDEQPDYCRTARALAVKRRPGRSGRDDLI
jgi:hypothetical protein